MQGQRHEVTLALPLHHPLAQELQPCLVRHGQVVLESVSIIPMAAVQYDGALPTVCQDCLGTSPPSFLQAADLATLSAFYGGSCVIITFMLLQ